MYGCEAWKLTKTEAKKPDAFQYKCMKRILRIRWPQTISHQQIQEITGMNRTSDEIRQRRWNWIGHIMRRDREEHCVTALEWRGRRSRLDNQPLFRKWARAHPPSREDRRPDTRKRRKSSLEKKTRSTKNNMEENGWGWKANSSVAVMGDGQSPSSRSWWMEGGCQSLMCLMAWRDIDIDMKSNKHLALSEANYTIYRNNFVILTAVSASYSNRTWLSCKHQITCDMFGSVHAVILRIEKAHIVIVICGQIPGVPNV